LIYSNGLRIKFAYDADGLQRVVCGSHPGGPPSNPDVFDFTNYDQTVDVDGMVRRTTHSAGLSGCSESQTPPVPQTNTYDSRHQLRTQTEASTRSYVYDGSGNRIRYRRYDGSTTFDDKVNVIETGHNRLVQSYDFATPTIGVDFGSDANGGRMEERPFCPGCWPDSIAGRRTYWYDGLGRTTGTREWACQENPGGQCEGTYLVNAPGACKYDPLGRLFDTCENAAPVLGYDGENVVRTSSDTWLNAWSFVHGPGLDDPIMGYFHASLASNDKYWYYATDGRGGQVAVGDVTGLDVSEQIEYQVTGGKFAGGTNNPDSFGADRHHNPEMYRVSFFRNRFYDQETGRWTQEDPIGVAGGSNLYQFNGNNPVTFSDPFGLCERPTGSGVGICIESFIAQPRVFGFLPVGDGRGPSGNGGSFKTSQRFSIDPRSGSLSGVQQHIGRTLGVPGGGVLVTTQVSGDGAGGWNLTVGGHATSALVPSGLDIDFGFKLNISANGQVTVTGGQHDGFPSYEIWVYPQGGDDAKRIYYHSEGNFFELVGGGDVKCGTAGGKPCGNP
jgi:RHS repeat-associated protein